jgi:hypothetical protein
MESDARELLRASLKLARLCGATPLAERTMTGGRRYCAPARLSGAVGSADQCMPAVSGRFRCDRRGLERVHYMLAGELVNPESDHREAA